MGAIDGIQWLAEQCAHELTLFAAVAFVIAGIDDLLVDLLWIARVLWRRLTVYSRFERASAATLPPPAAPGRIGLFVPAWREATVIAPMLRHALATFDHADYRIYVGCYPNDPDTIAAGRAIGDERIRIAMNPRNGPTTKADNLNAMWRALLADEAADGVNFKAIVLHDAEDVVHSAELRLFDSLIERFDLVQLPVLPLIDDGSRWVSGHYIDEFTEAHGKQLVVREAIGAGVPSAGVGCAVSRVALGEIAAANGGLPFDGDSLTEDYELGLRLARRGRRGVFVRLPSAGGGIVAVRAHFPAGFRAAVRQKARWMIGIALAGWDRLGWEGGWSERWMRLRDRRALLEAIVLFAAYAAMLGWAIVVLLAPFTARGPAPFSAELRMLLAVNLGFFVWRLAMRFAFVARAYGLLEGLRAVPRAIIGNIIAIFAARAAVAGYFRMRGAGRVDWDKTDHVFPAVAPAE